MPSKAVVLLSGGLDSTTTLAIAQNEGFDTLTLSFDYGQRHRVELDRARAIAEQMGAIEHRVVTVDLRQFGASALTDTIEVPTHQSVAEITSGVPATYVPARNTIFLSYALACAEVKECGDIFIGVNAIDYSGYPDCRPEYIAAFEKVANLATRAGIEDMRKLKIHTPLVQMTKAQIIQKGLDLGVDYSLTHSCYDPDENGIACGVCDSCLLRLKGFKEAGIPDPLKYRT
jgi:7-cyano-7-deazaguanine synthase